MYEKNRHSRSGFVECADRGTSGRGLVTDKLRPMTRADIIAVVCVAAAGAGLFFVLSSEPEKQPHAAAASAALPAAQTGISCPQDAAPTNRDYAGGEETILLSRPLKEAAPVHLKIMGATIPAPMREDAGVRELCRTGGWSLVHVLTVPKELQPLQGWVPSASLRNVKTTPKGRRIYEAADFDWPEGSAKHKRAALIVMNRIMDEQPSCKAMDQASLMFDRARGVFHVPCFDGGDMKSFDFTAADASNGRSFAPVNPIGKLTATDICKKAILERATHPSTVEFPMLDYDFREGGNGQTQLLMSAKAKNGFGLELEYDVQCDFHGSELSNFIMSEAAG